MTTGATTNWALPFPNGDDPVYNGDNVIRSLAAKLDQIIPRVAVGAISQMTGAANATRTATVTLPANLFKTVPQVVAGLATSNGSAGSVNTEVWVGTTTTSSFNVGVNRSNASDVAVRWVAGSSPAGPFTAAAFSAAAAAPEPDGFVSCPTDGCPNEGIPIPVSSTWADDDGVTQPISEFFCGVCGTRLEWEATS